MGDPAQNAGNNGEANYMVKKYKTCNHVTAIGQNVVYTSLNCPLANHLRGVLIVAKSQCTAFRAWERKKQ